MRATSQKTRYTPAQFPLDDIPQHLIPAETAKAIGAIPLRLRGDILQVAMVTPQDLQAADALEQIANCEIEPILCLPQEFSQLFGTVYGLEGNTTPLDADEILYPPSENGLFDATQPMILNVDDADSTEVTPSSFAMRFVQALLEQAVREGASDIHLSPERGALLIRLRIDGKLYPMPSPSSHLAPSILSRIKVLSNIDISKTRNPQDGRFTTNVENREINIRVSCLPTIYGENMVLRLLIKKSIHDCTLDKLGMDAQDSEIIYNKIQKPYGMILSSGPTGSGKSTSLYAILQRLNKPSVNIITLEDPIEYRIDGIRQVQLNNRADMTFASGLRAILRQDPDIIMVGEIRDSETAKIAIQAAFTGHLVLATFHANNASAAITRLAEMGIEPLLTASILLCSVAQRLVRTVCPHCAETCQPAEPLLLALGITNPENAEFKRGAGCYRCRNSGYLGRTGLFEVLSSTPDIQKLIMEYAHEQQIADTAQQLGLMRTLQQDAARKVCAGLTTAEEAVRVVMT